MNVRHILLLVLLVLPLDAQRKPPEIQRRERELQRLRNEIDAYEKKLRDSERRERSTLDRLDDLEEQTGLIRELIGRLREEERQMTAEIDGARTSIADLERQVGALTTHYAGWVRSLYMNGRGHDIEELFSSRSLNQLYYRLEYLRRFADQRVRDLQDLTDKKSALERQNEQLQIKLDNERQLLAEKTREENKLRRTYAERQTILRRVRKDKRAYQQELTKRTKAADRVEQLIASLIEEERKKKEREAEERRKRTLAEARKPERATRTMPRLPVPDPRPATPFGDRRGELRWPVASGAIAAKFGPVTHPILHTVTQNTGIDISTRSGSPVYAVADGQVSVLSFIPGFGNVLIIDHFDGYRTVYAHLSDVLVAEEQRVAEGMEIARSGETVSGSVLHFEIWHDKDKQNPETWLARR